MKRVSWCVSFENKSQVETLQATLIFQFQSQAAGEENTQLLPEYINGKV